MEGGSGIRGKPSPLSQRSFSVVSGLHSGENTPPSSRGSPVHSREGSPLLKRGFLSGAHPPLSPQLSAPPGHQHHERFSQLKRTNSLKKLLKHSIFGQSGDKVGSSGPAKEQRRSDPGSSAPCATSLNNHVQGSQQGGGDEDNSAGGADVPDQCPHSEASTANSADSTPNHSSKGGVPKKRSASSINRSESCKEKQNARKQARENRKNSDPNIPSSKSGDVDGDNNPLNFHSGSSSSSSLSQSPAGPATEHFESFATALENDSDIEAESDLPDWTQRLSPEVVERLHRKERKRQDTINEFFHTEQSHVRILKILQYLFHQPLRQFGYISSEHIDGLFANLEQMLRFHTGFNKAMKKRRRETPLVLQVGDIVENMFCGEEGQEYQQAAGESISCHSFCLEGLKLQQRRDPKLATFIIDQENLPICRRLQLKDMLPAGFQRLTKYPLLLESLLSYTDRSTQTLEYDQLAKALDRSKEILEHVNQVVGEAENKNRLREIQKRLDQSYLAKNKHGNCEELRGELDLTKHNLIYEGPLTWKTRGQKNLDLHVLILEECVVLLQKDNDRYVLKYHSISKNLGKDDKLNHSPIIKFGTFIFRPVAADKCALFIVVTQATLGHQIYELITISHNERNVWLRHLHEAQSAYEARDPRNRRHTHGISPDAADAADADDSQHQDAVRDVEDVDGEANESAEPQADRGKDQIEPNVPTNCDTTASFISQNASSPEALSKKTELLRRKDLKIRQELEEKQDLIADILNIPREDYESVADMAGEVGLANKEPRELVLGAIYQATKLQQTLNEAQNVKDSDVIAVQACTDPVSRASSILLQQGSVEKLLNVSGTLTQLLNSLLSLVSERDNERDRMRKELVASRERLHHLHMQKNSLEGANAETTDLVSGESCPKGETGSPNHSRPNSFVSVGSSGLEQTEGETTHTDEDCKTEELANISVIENKTELEDSTKASSPSEDVADSAVQTSPTHSTPLEESPLSSSVLSQIEEGENT